ncbi:hypothetical protein [Snodgrassella sp. ESL0253]|uniref:hypothetical protein n=1 Tax=Snodgrassella sp. ESL0253 TaxID=2705031 RepID=UPI0015837FC9|nr:hypothetical protein [Snodgrassella sp. ESL0253]NUE67215.1 hypothetical protein [Snodgrassella sp. ESL0253]
MECNLSANQRFRQTAQTFTIGLNLGQRNTDKTNIVIPHLQIGAISNSVYNEKNDSKDRLSMPIPAMKSSVPLAKYLKPSKLK